jgi:hypothetical protein
MRKMVKGNLKLSVVEHIISRTTGLNSIFPAAGYSWADEMPIRGRLLGERLDWRDE